MKFSKAFVVSMAVIMVFLLTAFATEDGRCVARARRALREILPIIPTSVAAAGPGAVGGASLDSLRAPSACGVPEPTINVRTRTPFGRQRIPFQPALLAGNFDDAPTS